MKKLVCMAAVGALCLSAFAGCGSSSEAPASEERAWVSSAAQSVDRSHPSNELPMVSDEAVYEEESAVEKEPTKQPSHRPSKKLALSDDQPQADTMPAYKPQAKQETPARPDVKPRPTGVPEGNPAPKPTQKPEPTPVPAPTPIPENAGHPQIPGDIGVELPIVGVKK